jgi:hypothetical protein
MSNPRKTIQAHGLDPLWRLTWWIFPPTANKRRQRPRARHLDFYTVELARKHATALKSEHGTDNVVIQLKPIGEAEAAP